MAPFGDRGRLFDRWSRTYDRPGLQAAAYRPVHDAVLARLADDDPPDVLDLGCGTGQLTRRLADRFPAADVVGLDASAGMLAEAAGADPTRGGPGDGGGGITGLVRADALRLPFATASFAVVTCTESFHWYPDQEQALAEIRRVLVPGGRFVVVSIATVTGIGDDLVRRITAAAGQQVAALPPRRLRRLLDRSGFRVRAQHRLPRLQPPWPVLTDAVATDAGASSSDPDTTANTDPTDAGPTDAPTTTDTTTAARLADRTDATGTNSRPSNSGQSNTGPSDTGPSDGGVSEP